MKSAFIIAACLLSASPAFVQAKPRNELTICIAYYDAAARGLREALSSFKTINTSDGKILVDQLHGRAAKLREVLRRIDAAEGIHADTSEAAIQVETEKIWPLMKPTPVETSGSRAQKAIDRWAVNCANLHKAQESIQP
jgi:hypothetical protein